MELYPIVRGFRYTIDPPTREIAMAHASRSKIDKIQHPQTYYDSPDELIEDQNLSAEEKKMALEVWEQDARQMLMASNEGMPGREEGVSRGDHHQLGQVERAKAFVQNVVLHKGSKSIEPGW